MTPTHLWPFSKSKLNLKSDRVNLLAPAGPIECLLYFPNVRAIQYKLGPERLTRLGISNPLRLPVPVESSSLMLRGRAGRYHWNIIFYEKKTVLPLWTLRDLNSNPTNRKYTNKIKDTCMLQWFLISFLLYWIFNIHGIKKVDKCILQLFFIETILYNYTREYCRLNNSSCKLHISS